MTFTSLEPFVPSGPDFQGAKQLFLELGFKINWDAGDYIGFQRDTCRFVLQKFDDRHFAENLMIGLKVSNLDEFWEEITKKELSKKFKIHLKEPTKYPYGREVHLIDIAGVCWHISEE